MSRDCGYTDYAFGGVIFRVTDPVLTFREEGDKAFCRVQSQMQIIQTPKVEAPRPSAETEGGKG